MWIIAAFLSAAFASLTTILSKLGVKEVGSNVATAIRSSVVFLFAACIALATGGFNYLSAVNARSWIFLILSGLATGASWLCFFKALSLGEASKVSAVDKSSVAISLILAILIFPDERDRLAIKLPCLCLIAVGTFLMTDVKKSDDKASLSYLFFAILSAVFAALTSILAKIGTENVDSNAATAIRSGVVLVIAWLIVVANKEVKTVKDVSKKSALFLLLSGLATGVGWLFYYYAVQQGLLTVVIPIDKLSVVLTALASVSVFKEKLSKKSVVGLIFLTAGIIIVAVFG